MSATIQVKRGVLANRPALASGEFYYSTDTNQVSIGPTPTFVGSPVVAVQNLTGLAAVKAATTLFTPAVTGLFRISCVLKITTAATTSCTLGGAGGVVVTYTDGDGSLALSQTMGMRNNAGAAGINATTNSTATQINGDMYLYAKAGVSVTFTAGYASTGATSMVYSCHMRVEAL